MRRGGSNCCHLLHADRRAFVLPSFCFDGALPTSGFFPFRVLAGAVCRLKAELDRREASPAMQLLDELLGILDPQDGACVHFVYRV